MILRYSVLFELVGKLSMRIRAVGVWVCVLSFVLVNGYWCLRVEVLRLCFEQVYRFSVWRMVLYLIRIHIHILYITIIIYTYTIIISYILYSHPFLSSILLFCSPPFIFQSSLVYPIPIIFLSSSSSSFPSNLSSPIFSIQRFKDDRPNTIIQFPSVQYSKTNLFRSIYLPSPQSYVQY